MTPTEARRAKREQERHLMTVNALLRDPSATFPSNENTISKGQTQILIDGLNRIAAEIQNISRLLARSVQP